MKSNFIKLVLGSAMLFVAIGLFQSCQKLEDVANDVSLVLDTDLLFHPLMLQYVDAHENGFYPEGLEIEIRGPGKDKVQSLLGSEEIIADGHYVNIGVRKIENLSVDNPIEIMIVAKAPGYVTSYKYFVIHDTQMGYNTIPMVKIGRDAPGITTEEESFNLTASGTTESAKFNSSLNYGKQEKATVNVKAGTKMYDAQGNQLQGMVEASLTHFDNRHDVAAKAYAGGASTSRNIKDVDGTDLGPGMIVPYGVMTLDMYVNDKEVKTFSQPLEVKVTLNPNSINSETGQPIQEGDEVAVASYDEFTGEWQIELRETIERNAQGQLEVRYDQPHLSTWVIGSPVPPGCFFFQATVKSPIPAFSTVQRFFYVELRNVADESLVGTNFLQKKNDEIITFFFVPNITGRVDVFDGNEVCNGGLLGQSDPLNLCGFVGEIDLNDDPAFLAGELLISEIEVSGICDEITPTLVVAPTLTILYKDTHECDDEALWHPLGIVSGGTGTTAKLRAGNMYDFRIAEGGINRTIRNIPVPSADSSFTVDYVDVHSGSNFTFNQVIDVDYNPGPGGVGQQIKFTFHNIDIPDCACAIWRCHQNGGSANDCDPMVAPGAHPLSECQ